MARSVEDIEVACRVVFGKSANYSSAPVLYRDVKLRRKLKFGYYFDDGMVRTTPACRRAVSETVEALRRQGHECEEVELPSRELVPACGAFQDSYGSLQRRKRSRFSQLSRQHLGLKNSSKIKVRIRWCDLSIIAA